MHCEESLCCLDLRNFRSRVEADEGRNEQFGGGSIAGGRLVKLCK
jgi:hypothetical protein